MFGRLWKPVVPLVAAVTLMLACGSAVDATPRADAGWQQLTTGAYLRTCGIRADGTLWCWGNNAAGSLGVGDQTERLTPTQVGDDSNWLRVAGGFEFTCGIRTDHTLWCWGLNDWGQLGDPDESAVRVTPTQVGADADWLGVTAGFYHTCGIRTDHTLWCWGKGRAGQLGLGGTSTVWTPTQVGGHDNWLGGVTAGSSYTCGIRTNHTVWCWGQNTHGQLGLGDLRGRRSIPRRVGVERDWLNVSTGDGHTCGTRTDHSLWCWGNNEIGQLGLGDTTDVSIPTRVGDDADWEQVDAGYSHTCAIRIDNTLWCWGNNYSGMLGLGNATGARFVPTQVGADSVWGLVAVDSQSCAIRTDQTLWCWGYNLYGPLGVGDKINRYIPTSV